MDDTATLAATFEALDNAIKARRVDAGVVALARTVSDTPPVHENCRCAIGPDGSWTDAGDARVCIYCMTLGAAWNLRLDQPPNDQEIADLLDRDGREAFRKAIEKDSTVADSVIRDAAQKSTGGVLRGISITTGKETLTVAVEREATRELAVKRASAAIQPGHVVPGLGTAQEGLVFETTAAGRKKPVVLYVTIAETLSHRVIRRTGRYYVQTVGGRTLAADDNLALALLILLALTEKERREREERERKANATR